MEPRIIGTLLAKEINDALNNRWFMLYAAAFAGLALLLSWLSLSGGAGYSGFAGFGRTAASLVNLVLLVVPLMALTIGADSLVSEREQGTLPYLLAQPVSRAEVLLGKYLGLAASVLGALALGFGLSGMVIAGQGAHQTNAAAYGLIAAFAFGLALAMLSLGFLISVLARKVSVATGVALLVWLSLVFVGDLGLMGTTLVFKLPIDTLFHLAVVNPLQVFKMSTLLSINATLDVLGPAGIYGLQTYRDHLTWLFLGSLLAWIVLPLLVTFIIFQRRGDV